MRNVTEQDTHILDVVELRAYCATKGLVPEDEHEPYVAFYEITGTSLFDHNSNHHHHS